MSNSKVVWAFLGFVLIVVTAASQNQPQPQIKHVPIQATSASSGVEMFKTYCAACHGISGKGDGPAAPALKVPPADLTVLARNNGGKYPELKVSSVIRGQATLPAHGSREMPVWGTLFRSMSQGHEGEVQQRVANLTKYVETLQEK
jgi:mono/diheme cytochrome c family protein